MMAVRVNVLVIMRMIMAVSLVVSVDVLMRGRIGAAFRLKWCFDQDDFCTE